jgi:hypothetical protein
MDNFHDLFGVLRFSAGRRIRLYDQILPLAKERKLREVIAYIVRARSHDMELRALENQWAADAGRRVYADSVQALDQVVDQNTTSVRDVAVGHVRGLPADNPLRREVGEFVTAVFPAGPGAITSLPYVDQVAACEVVVEQVQGRFAPLMARLGLTDKVAYLAALVAEYRDEVNKTPEPLDYAVVREMRDRGHKYMVDILAMIGGRYYDSDNREHVATRDELLAPFFAQHHIVRAGYRLRRSGQARPEDTESPDSSSDAPAAEPSA